MKMAMKESAASSPDGTKNFPTAGLAALENRAKELTPLVPCSVNASSFDKAGRLFVAASEVIDSALDDSPKFEDRSNNQDGNSFSGRRKKRSFEYLLRACPMCGITLRTGEVESHFQLEKERLKSTFIGTGKGSHHSSSTRKANSSQRKMAEEKSIERNEKFLQTKGSRLKRTYYRARVKNADSGENSKCPICKIVLSGSPEEMNSHAEACLRKRENAMDGSESEGDLDIEGFEEYTWAGQTRVRATSMVEGGISAVAGFQTGYNRRQPPAENSEELNVDVDDSQVYGAAQYTEKDVIPCTSDEPREERERKKLRRAILRGVHSQSPDSQAQGGSSKSNGPSKIQSPTKPDSFRCLICMESYKTPLTSVQCWHVHCEDCWLRTLGAKKLCPQCNIITSPTDLRRIYL